jgi:hypothetical protein
VRSLVCVIQQESLPRPRLPVLDETEGGQRRIAGCSASRE